MRFGLLSTYPPTQCGLATFTRALADAIVGLAGCECFVVRSVEHPVQDSPTRVVQHLVAGDRLSARRAAEALNYATIAVIQHEYGIYGGMDGEELLDVQRLLRVPSIVVLHTVLRNPSSSQRRVLQEVCDRATAIVAMSRAACDQLLATHPIDPDKVVVIPHGAHPTPAVVATPISTRILTWGLLGPGKGIEWGVHALAMLQDLDPQPEYLVAGQIHPKVAQRDGEAYREQLQHLAQDLGVDHLLRFDPSYRPTSALAHLIGSAAVVLLPYDSDEQVTSGVLIEAVAAGRPVVATRFPHAVELLTGGVGITVPHRDPEAIAAALRTVLTQPNTAAAMRTAARQAGAKLEWPVVAAQYHQLARHLLTAQATHLAAP